MGPLKQLEMSLLRSSRNPFYLVILASQRVSFSPMVKRVFEKGNRMNKSWLITLAIVGSTTSFAVHALSADKSDSVFIDEGDGDFDSMPIPPQTALKPA